MTFICIDIGNTRVKVCIEEDGQPPVFEVYERLSELPVKEWQSLEKVFCILSSTASDKQLQFFDNIGFEKIIHLGSKTPLPFVMDYNSPDTLGADRIALAAAAKGLYPASNVLAIDAGTCITLDFVNAEGKYLGGSIHPGLKMRLKAMHQFTANLPMPEVQLPEDFIMKDTKTCMQAGAIYAATLEIDAFIDLYRHRHDNCKVLLTGGDADLFFSKLKNEIFAHPNLVLTGLLEIAKYNV